MDEERIGPKPVANRAAGATAFTKRAHDPLRKYTSMASDSISLVERIGPMVRARLVVRSSPLAVAGCVFVIYAGWVAYAHFGLHHRMSDFAFIGTTFSHQSSVSPAINADRSHATSPAGYDGQYFLYLAQDPIRAKAYIDDPAYRYGRIVYPLLARALAFGQQDAIPFVLVAINVLAVALGTFALATLLCRHGRSPWYALIFALYPGIYVAVLRDLSEALAYALAACAVALFDRARPGDLVAERGAFRGRDPDARDHRRLRARLRRTVGRSRPQCPSRPALRGGSRLALRLLPRGAAAGLVRRNPGYPPVVADIGAVPRHRPYYPWNSDALREVYSIVLPGVLCLALSAWALLRRRWDIGLWALAANALLFVILLPAPPYEDIYASSRVTTGVVMGFVIAIPALTQLRPSFRWLGAVIVLAWMAPWWVLYRASWFPYGRQPGESRPTQYLGVSIQGSTTTALPGQEVDFTIWSTNADPVHGYGTDVLASPRPRPRTNVHDFELLWRHTAKPVTFSIGQGGPS